MDEETGPKTACLIGSALNGTDAYPHRHGQLRQPGAHQGEPLSAAQPLRQPPVGKGRHAAGLHGADLFAPGRLRLRQSRHRHRRPHDPGRGLRLCPGRRRGDLPDSRDHSGLFQHVGHRQGGPQAIGPLRTRPRPRGPFRIDRRGFVLSEGGGVLVLAAEEMLHAWG